MDEQNGTMSKQASQKCGDSPTGKHLWGKFHYADGGMSFTKCKHCLKSKKQVGLQ